MARWLTKVWGGGVAVGLAAAVAAPWLAARWNAARSSLGDAGWGVVKADSFPAPELCEVLLVVARRPERQGEDDPMPHRNSRVALYRRAEQGWTRAAFPLEIRSETTAIEPKPHTGEIEVAGERRTNGYASVPFGVFTLEQAPWRDGVTPAFKISDWGRFDGRIGLHSPQVLRQTVVETDPETGETTRMVQVLRSSLDKSGSWIHPTHTRIWSHGDSNGCMNLYRPEQIKREGQTETESAPSSGGEEAYPYDIFLSWFSERGLAPGPGPDGDLVPLIVVPFEYVHQPGTEDELMTELPPDIFDRARAIQGRQMGELQ